ncbi:ArnT family glycosyltransferase [Methylophaga nitratireducenticrescens]|uniref:Glycosyl transferase n=1 Tax=Methylophaga nitratireducenticrescens TaxID=754476 RepID=I1XIN2_METNJ|nr:glycosyltransferase family 39 protein [Methylophaga nitratireducenticrescens]AFI84251.1 glycosyl transferase family 39 [Methylophaga nitratireducenticrescens]AUZ84329.1 glycosyl transferase family 39 [Methylophaga nitratireducenticrescens]
MKDTLMTPYAKNTLYIVLIALALRLLWLLLIPVIPVSDSVMYHEFAKSISSGNGYAFPAGNLTAYWPVGTPAIYAFLYTLFGESFFVIAVFNLIVGLLTLVLMMALARLWFNEQTAYIVGILYAIWPSQIQFTTILASETIFNVFILLGLFFWYRSQSNTLSNWIIGTIFFVAATYVRPIALLIPFILIGLSFLRGFDFKQLFSSSIIIVITMTILIAPWAARNYDLFDEFVLISTNGGPVFWMGNNPDSTGEYMPLPKDLEFDSETERADYFKSEAIKHIKEEPGIFAKRLAKRFVDYFRSENIGVNWNIEGIKQQGLDKTVLPLKLMSSGYWIFLVLLAIYGGIRIIRSDGFYNAITTTPIIALISYNTALHTIIASGDRYHFPIIPFVGLLAAYALFRMKSRIET